MPYRVHWKFSGLGVAVNSIFESEELIWAPVCPDVSFLRLGIFGLLDVPIAVYVWSGSMNVKFMK